MSSSNYEFDFAVGSTLDYGLDWKSKGWLDIGELIATSTWVASSTDITLSLSQNIAGITSVFVTGGVVGTVYKITNTIVTDAANPRTDSRTITLSCKVR